VSAQFPAANWMNLLRRASTRGLVAAAVALLALVALVTVAVVAALGSSVPRPPAETLGRAIHDALAAPPPAGLSARISYSAPVLGLSGLASIPQLSMLAGGSGRLWVAGDGHARLELSSPLGDTEILYDGSRLTLYDVSTQTAYELALRRPPVAARAPGSLSLAEIDAELRLLSRVVRFSAALPDSVAGRPAYTVTVSPAPGAGEREGSVALSFDARTGTPLRLRIEAPGSSAQLLELRVTAISYGPVAASDVEIALPAGVKIVTVRGA
jgi:outer membrane lipoprotein-sorting protein